MWRRIGWVAGVVNRHVDFELALTGYRRKYPIHEFQSLVAAVRGYIRAPRGDKMIHRAVLSELFTVSPSICG
jgi:hypothetical protein